MKTNSNREASGYPESRWLPVVGFLSVFLIGSPIHAQQSASSVSEPKTEEEEKIVQLSVFEVQTTRDKGYSSSQSIGATRMGMALKEIPQNIAVINENLLRDVAARSISDAARYMAGVTQTSGSASDTITIRGVNVNNPNSNGLPDVGSSQGTGLDMALFDRIEILKGPSAVIYGSTSSGGVVNRTMKKPSFERSGGYIDLEAGSFADYRGVLDINRVFGANQQFAVRLIGSYWTREAEQDFSFGRRRFIAPEFSWRVTPDTTVTVIASDYHDRYYKGWTQIYTLPPYTTAARPYPISVDLDIPHSRAYAEPYSVQWEEATRINLDVTHRFSDAWSVRLAGYTGEYGYHEDPTTIPRDLVVVDGRYFMQRSWRNSKNPSESSTIALDSAWNFNLGPTKHKLVALAQYSEGNSDTLQYLGRGPTGSNTNVLPLLDIENPVYGGQPTTTYLSSDTHSEGDNLGFAVQEQAYFFKEKLILQAGIRHDRNSSSGYNRLTSVANNPDAVTHWTPRYGAVFRFSEGISVYYSRSETFTPVFSANVDGTTFTPPTSEQDEIGAKIEILGGKVSAMISYYDRTDMDTILSHPDPALASLGWRVQVPGDNQKGYEMDLLLSPVNGLELMFGGARIDANALSGLRSRNVPNRQFTFLGAYTVPRGVLKGLKLGLAYRDYGDRPGDSGNTFFLPAFNAWDGFAGYAWAKNELHLTVRNLTDEWYADSAVNRNIVRAGDPRTFQLRYTRRF